MSTPTLNTWDIAPQAAGFDWIYWKSWLSLYLKMSDDMLHIHVGLILLIAAAFVLRRPPWHWLPWLSVAAVEGVNELYDVFQTAYVTDEGNWASAWHDFWLTMLWPTAIALTFPWLSRHAARRGDSSIPAAPSLPPRSGAPPTP